MEKKLSRRQKEKLVIIAVFGVGILLGIQFQKGVTLKSLKDAIVLTRSATPMFPDTMPIDEIKQVLSSTTALVRDAIVVTLDGRESFIIR